MKFPFALVLHRYAKEFALKTRAAFSPIRSKPKSIMTHWHTFSRASRQLRVCALNFDWFTALPVLFVIGKSVCPGFSFRTLN